MLEMDNLAQEAVVVQADITAAIHTVREAVVVRALL
jgi:hypothetical protein